MNSFSFRPRTFKRSLSRSQELKWCEQELISLQHLISKLYISAVPVTLIIDKHLMTMYILFSWFTFEIDLENNNRFTFQYHLITFGRWVLILLRQQTASWYVNPVVIVVIVWSLWPKSIVKQQQKRDYYFGAFHGCSGTTVSVPSEIANFCLFLLLSTMWKWSNIYRSAADISFLFDQTMLSHTRLDGPNLVRESDYIMAESLINYKSKKLSLNNIIGVCFYWLRLAGTGLSDVIGFNGFSLYLSDSASSDMT